MKIFSFILFLVSTAHAQTAYTNYLDEAYGYEEQAPQKTDPFMEIKGRSAQNYKLTGNFSKDTMTMLEDNKAMIRLIMAYELMNKTFVEIGCVEKDYKEQIYKSVFVKGGKNAIQK